MDRSKAEFQFAVAGDWRCSCMSPSSVSLAQIDRPAGGGKASPSLISTTFILAALP
jgi:hypothetical protein